MFLYLIYYYPRAGLPTGPCSTFLSSCSLLTLQMEACLKRKKEKKKIILLSTLTFSPNFCFDSESHLNSYQGIKITTSVGPSSFLWPGSLFCGYISHCSIFPMVCVCSSYFRALELAFPCAWNALPSLMSLSGQILDNQVSFQRSAFQMSFIALLSQV